MDNSINSILKVKLDNEWVEVPALRGSSVYSGPSSLASKIVEGGRIQYGTVIRFIDERKKATDPSYECDEYTIWDGLNGEGTVETIDSVHVDQTGINIPLEAVRYGAVQTLSDGQQLQARTNINAQVAGNYITSPSNKIINQFLQYLGNDNWVTSNVQVLPSSETIGMLMKTSASMDDLTWVPALSSTEIDNIVV